MFSFPAQPIFENPEDYVVHVRAIGIANLHSEWSTPILVQRVLSLDFIAVGNLKCQAVIGNGSNAELELSWNLGGLPTVPPILHYLVGRHYPF